MQRESTIARRQRAAASLNFPAAAVPRPGARVAWFAEGRRREATLIGHLGDGAPYVRTDHDITRALPVTLDQLTRVDPLAEERRAWDYLPAEAIVEPLSHEAAAFEAAMAFMTPPGLRYADMAEAVCARGFELLVVGGAVRDVIAGTRPHDLDVVTAMPLARAKPLFEQMYQLTISHHAVNGFLRIGTPENFRGKFIDVKAIIHDEQGDESAIFGCNLLNDFKQRDFACNALYYEPYNKVLLDPSSRGIADALDRRLTLVYEPEGRPPKQLAQIGIRFLKFLLRGLDGDTIIDRIRTEFLPKLYSMTPREIGAYVQRQILGKLDPRERDDALAKLENKMRDIACDQLWAELVAPAIQRRRR
jgi:hypothetical protein